MDTLTFTSTVVSLNGSSYFGARDKSITDALAAPRKLWADTYDSDGVFAANKLQRDRTSDLHVTVLTPSETRKLKKERSAEAILESFGDKLYEFTLVGPGVVRDGDSTAWFFVLESPQIQAVRSVFGLPEHNLHTTFGFDPRDVFTKPKDRTSLLSNWSAS